eukprot:2934687-Pleurochrysis_carterae.AAC.1
MPHAGRCACTEPLIGKPRPCARTAPACARLAKRDACDRASEARVTPRKVAHVSGVKRRARLKTAGR